MPVESAFMIRLAIAQIASSTQKHSNLNSAAGLIQEAKAKGARMIAFPEFLMAFSPPHQSAEELAAAAEAIDGPFTSSLRESARAARIDILATIFEKCPAPGRVYDTAIWIDQAGDIAAVYRKLHLYDAFGIRESDKFLAGDDIAPPVHLDDGRFGVMICYDLRFPEMARMMALAGANVLVAPSGWVQGDLKVDHWQTMLRARALENGCYVIAPDQVRNTYVGHSMAVDPLGRTVVDMGRREGLSTVEIDFALVLQVREQLPLLKNRRAEVYAKYRSENKIS